MFVKHARYPLAVAFVALMSACSQDSAPGQAPSIATDTPKGSVDQAVASLKAGDLKSLVLNQVPAKHLDRLRAEWKADIAKETPSDSEKAEFAKTMADLTAPDAETKMLEQLEPQLVKFEQEMVPQMPMMIGFGRGMIEQGIQGNTDLTDQQKQEAVKSIGALATWVQQAKFTDRALAKQAIGHVTAAAREINIKTLDEARALDFDQALEKGSIAFRAAKKVLDTYGLSLDKSLDSIKTEVVSTTGNEAKVKVSYTFLDQPLSFDTDLVQVDGKWYGKQAIAELEKPKVEEPAADDSVSDDSLEDSGDETESAEEETAEG